MMLRPEEGRSHRKRGLMVVSMEMACEKTLNVVLRARWPLMVEDSLACFQSVLQNLQGGQLFGSSILF